ncbi:glycosyltransferase [Leifsonia sp. ZF2019]|uniref:glycosyltransferase family 2 protein n=1 Tax=Leifsonia sp. ZF2019 TaxID=2781978 RepID=UPI001CBFAA77|nr:glycosyltransferase family 2 protein [Leifsonia sp. ZF2019]UAJ80293.1 glycosyltransferase [Leifsonia sp. ZF2019]
MTSLSVCMLARNEEDNIGRSLQTTVDFADEVVVVDNGSTDATADVATSMGARVIYRPNALLDEGREAYLRAAACDWILVIDADEVITSADGLRLRAILAATPADVAGYALPRHDYLGDGRWANGRLLRLFRRSPRVHYEGGSVHATPWAEVKRLGRVDVENYVPIHHLDLLINGSSRRKRDTYRIAMERAIAKGQDTGAFAAYLAAEYAALGSYDEAIAVMQPVVDSEPTARNLVFTAQFLARADRLDVAEGFATRALALGPRFREQATTVLCEGAIERGDVQRARSLLAELAAQAPNSPSVHLNLAAVSEYVGCDDRTDLHVENAVRLNPLLDNPLTFRHVTGPALYRHQDAILSIAEGILARLKARIITES